VTDIGPERLISDLQQQMATMNQYQEKIAEIQGVGEAASGLVGATVGSGGVVKDIRLDPRAMRMDSHSLREALLAAIAAATTHANEQMAELSSDLTASTRQLADPAGLRQQLDQMMGEINRAAGSAQANLEVLVRKMRQAR
jgi:DNA-binding protein YbaB